MTDPLEQRLRDALKAHAESVGEGDLDRTRESAVASASSGARHSGWNRLAAIGLAAAAVVVGAVTVSNLTGTHDPVERADPLPVSSSPTESASAPARTRTDAAPTERRSAPKSAPATQEPRTRRTQPAPERTSAPPETPQRRAPVPPSAPPSQAPPTTEAPEASPNAEPAPPSQARTAVQPAAMNVSVQAVKTGATQMLLRVTANGTAKSSSPTGGVLNVTVDHGDGTRESRRIQSQCEAGEPVRPVTFTDDGQQHDYRRTGTYQVRVQVDYCAADGTPASDTTTRTVTVD